MMRRGISSGGWIELPSTDGPQSASKRADWVEGLVKREIVDLGLLTQTKISKDLFLRPKSPSLFHLSKALKL